MVAERRAASELQAKLRSGQFVVTAEITPPVSTDPAEFLRRAMPLKGLATAVNITDGAGAKVHLSSLATAHFLVQSGIEPIFQMTCRDRNRLALQGDILGAAALGIHNILVLGGDDPKAGDQPEAKREGRQICIEVLRELAEIPGVAGAHVMAPMNFAEIPVVITESGVAGRP